MDSHKIDLLLQFILAVASQNDPGGKKLGPIHLIKYVYLADLAHAERTCGNTFTGVNWSFYHFGPWAREVWERIDQALQVINATKEKESHPKYRDDFVRYSLENDEKLVELERQLPFHIVLPIKKAIRQYANDTASLLHHVYLTTPMLRATPGELLDFSPLPEEPKPHSEAIREPRLKEKLISKERLKNLKNRMRARLEAKKKVRELVDPDPPPLYDDVFFQGVRDLDALAGEPIEKREYIAEFSDEVWKSRSRYDPDLS